MEWLDNNQIKIEPRKKNKKITGTRFAALLGLNKWATPFATWCEITKTYEKPFEDTIYTIAGKTIEPKQAQFMKKSYGMTNLITPQDVYGEDPFKTTFGDFFHENPIFGGMWDYLLVDDFKVPTTVLEMKTTKRVEDWQDDIPEYYAMQAALYARLLGVDDVIMVCSVLSGSDYDNPEEYEPSISNTFVRPFKVSERYPNFNEYVEYLTKWWVQHVEGGISPEYSEKDDAEILAELRKNTPKVDSDLTAIIDEAERLKAEIDKALETVKDKQKRLKDIEDAFKNYSMSQFRPGDKQVVFSGGKYAWTISKGITKSIDKDKLINDGIYDDYLTEKETYRMTVKMKGEK